MVVSDYKQEGLGECEVIDDTWYVHMPGQLLHKTFVRTSQKVTVVIPTFR